MEQKKIDRINALARKSKTAALSDEEKQEQQALRDEYLASVRRNFTAQLDNVQILEPDGKVTALKPKKKNGGRSY